MTSWHASHAIDLFQGSGGSGAALSGVPQSTPPAADPRSALTVHKDMDVCDDKENIPPADCEVCCHLIISQHFSSR